MQSVNGQLPIYELYRAVFRHKGKEFLWFSAVMAATVAVCLVLPAKYRSEAKFLVRLGRENATLDPTASLGNEAVVTGLAQAREYEINSIADLLSGRVFVEKLVDRFGAAAILGSADQAKDSDPQVRAQAIRTLQERLDVKSVPKSNVVQVTYDGPTPELAQSLVTELLQLYVAEHARLNRTQGAHEFLVRETESIRRQLSAKEQELRDLKNQCGVISPDRQRQKIVEQIGALESDLFTANAEIAAGEVQVRKLREKLATLPETEVTAETSGTDDHAIAGVREQLYSLELKEQQLLASATKAYFEVPQVDQQLSRAREILSREKPMHKETTRGPGRNYQETHLMLLRQEPQLAASQAKAESLQANLRKLREQLVAFNEADLRINQLQREVDLQDANYRKYVANLEQARIDQALDAARISSISIAQPATYDAQPYRRRRLMFLMLGFGAALGGAVSLAFVFEYLDHSVQTPDDLERILGLPVLGSIPRLKGKQLLIPRHARV